MFSVTDSQLKATAKLWSEVAQFTTPTDALLSKFFREQRKLNLRDRNVIAETIYTILRNYNKLTAVVAPERSFTLIGYAWLHLLRVEREELRNIKGLNLGELDRLPAPALTSIELPAWVVEQLAADMPEEEIAKLARTLAAPAPLTLRVNNLKTNRNELLAKLAEQDIAATPCKYSPYGIQLKNKAALMQNQLFLDGWFEVQDEASQLAGLLLQPKRSEMIADFCAGSGGKTLLFGMLMKNSGRIYAFDINERRLGNLAPRLARSGLSNVYPQVINNENDSRVKRLTGKLDRVFVDAPCSGLGTLRRNPDLKFRQSPASLAEIQKKQLAILTAASRLVKPGGRLVYATCSILRAENQGIIEQFLSETPGFSLVPVEQLLTGVKIPLTNPEYLELRPDIHGCDGFFAGVLQKNSQPDEE